MTSQLDTAIVDRPYIQWGPVIAGAIAASAISFLMLTFGGAIGLSLASPWPYEGARASHIAIAIGIWTAVVQIGAFAAGGYLAGRCRSRWDAGYPDESQFRDGAHGFMVWAVGIVVGALLLALAGASGVKTAVESTATVAAGAAGGATARGPESLGTSPTDYAVDLLLRPAPNAQQPAAVGNAPGQTAGNRDEVSRVFANAIANRALTAGDRDYLAALVTARTGLPQAEAEQRVTQAVQEAQRREIQAREAADTARKTAVLSGFLAAASILIGLGAAIAGASLGGRHRDQSVMPLMFGRRFG